MSRTDEPEPAGAGGPRRVSAGESAPGRCWRVRGGSADGSAPAAAAGGAVEHTNGPDAGARHGLPELIAERRAKAQRLRETAGRRLPLRLSGVEPIAHVRAAYEQLAVGEESDERHRVAGRLAGERGQGARRSWTWSTAAARSSSTRVWTSSARRSSSGLRSLDLGDLVGVDGAVLRSRHGELTLRVEGFEVLAKALRPPPDKHHGLTDVEIRQRQRELDLIASEDVRRAFASARGSSPRSAPTLTATGFLEVETPVLQPIYGGALARPFTTHHNALDRTLYLRIATELYLKRLIVGGLERVYELGKDFRNEGISTKHNPEFTMVEWYEAYADYNGRRAQAPAKRVVARRAAEATPTPGRDRLRAALAALELRRGRRARPRASTCSRHPTRRLAAAVAAARRSRSRPRGATWPQIADELLSKLRRARPAASRRSCSTIPPRSRRSRAPHRSRPGLAERWEAFVGGMEIANAFSELTDPDDQRERFEAQRRLAAQGDEETQPHDELFLQSLETGCPRPAASASASTASSWSSPARARSARSCCSPRCAELAERLPGAVGRLSYGGDGSTRLIFLGDSDEEVGTRSPAHQGSHPSSG